MQYAIGKKLSFVTCADGLPWFVSGHSRPMPAASWDSSAPCTCSIQPLRLSDHAQSPKLAQEEVYADQRMYGALIYTVQILHCSELQLCIKHL